MSPASRPTLLITSPFRGLLGATGPTPFLLKPPQVSFLQPHVLSRQGCEPELFRVLGKSCSLGQPCMGCPELVRAWLDISGVELPPGQAFQPEPQCPGAALPSFRNAFPSHLRTAFFCSLSSLTWLTLTANPAGCCTCLGKARLPGKTIKIFSLFAQIFKA